MRASQWFLTTLKETPQEAEVISHQLMLRAGMIRKLGAGLYTWLPLGLTVLRKVETIIREEMNRSLALEVLMPAIQPAELWQETGRWDTFGGQLLTMQDHHGRHYCFGPTHEEIITDLVRHELNSYKQLPITFYQIQTKFRDEIRPRYGVMRAREFTMKDAYSFHLTTECLQKTYSIMHETYCRIFDRLGLTFRAVEADSGAIGGAVSHEFQVLADSGEDLIFYSNNSQYAANIEQARSLKPEKATVFSDEPMQLVSTPACKTIAQISDCLTISPNAILKTLIVEGSEHPLVVLVLRGDDELNETKAAKHPWVKSPVQFATEEQLAKANLVSGFIGPVKLSLPIIADFETLAMPSFVCGANQPDAHLVHACWERDAYYQDSFDLRNVREGDASPDGQGILQSCRGIEVGHIFQLGDKYSNAMQAQVTNEQGQLQTLLMGCYGVGVSRIVAAAIEQHHDEKGIVWPVNLAPFKLVIIPINAERTPTVASAAESLYQQCLALGIEVLLDDRNLRPGVSFADHDLIGIPHRLVISERLLNANEVEYKSRKEASAINLSTEQLNDFLHTL